VSTEQQQPLNRLCSWNRIHKFVLLIDRQTYWL